MPDASLANGRLVIILAQGAYSGATTYAAYRRVITVTNGVVNIDLEANTVLTPSGTVYRVEYYLVNGTTQVEYWSIPVGGPYAIRDVRTTTVAIPNSIIALSQLSTASASKGDLIVYSGSAATGWQRRAVCPDGQVLTGSTLHASGWTCSTGGGGGGGNSLAKQTFGLGATSITITHSWGLSDPQATITQCRLDATPDQDMLVNSVDPQSNSVTITFAPTASAGYCIANGSTAGGGGGGGGAPTDATYITQTPHGTLSNEQALSLLSTGLLKSTTGTGVISIAAAGTDYSAPGHSHATSDVTSGTFADARIAASNVTQHQAALVIAWGQLSGVPSTFPPSTHAASHQHSGSDEVATATPGANAIPKSGGGGTLAIGWIPDLSTTYVPVTRTLTGGSGIAAIGDLSANRTISTASGETDFLAAGALTCGAGTRGRIQIHTAPLQYCDDAATPVLRYTAYGDSAGAALTGDSATSFFASGQIEPSRGGTGIDSSASTGIARVSAGVWSTDANISHLASSSSAQLRAVVSDENGTGVALFDSAVNATLLDVTVDDLLTFTESAGDATCSAGDYWIKGNSAINKLRGCENGTTFDINTTAGASSWSSLSAPTGATNFVSDATSETVDFQFHSAFAAGNQYVIRQNTGNPTGGILFAVTASDTDPVLSLFQRPVDGSAVLMTIENSQSNAASSINETADIRALFGGIDAGLLRWGKTEDYTSSANESSYVAIHTRTDGTTAESARFLLNGVLDLVTGLRIGNGATSGRYLRGNGTNFVVSSGAAAGTGTCTNQVVRILNDDASPTCITITSAYVDSSIGLTGSPLSQFAATTSAQLAGVLSDETGSGVAVFGTSPTISSPSISGNASFVSYNDWTEITAPANPSSGVVRVYAKSSSGELCSRSSGGVETCMSAGGGGGTHNILSSTHSDTVAATVVRGDIITGNSTPAWSRLALGSSATFLRSNGTDLVYAAISATDLPIRTIRFPLLDSSVMPNNANSDVYFEPYPILATNDVWHHGVWRFGASNSAQPTVRSCIAGVFNLPSSLASTVSTANAVFVWTGTGTTGNVVWDFEYRIVGGDDTTSLDQSGTQQSVTATDAMPSAAHQRLVASIALTAGNFSGQSNTSMTWQACRDGVDANDTAAFSALLHSLLLEVSTQ
jgi:hypothetical protein